MTFGCIRADIPVPTLIQDRGGRPQPTDDYLQFAANLAMFYSDLRMEGKAPATAAEPKHLLKPKGAPLGAIKLREE
jgi:predicted ribosome quality control (RQC) complex YloA/Tae2 family protein